MAIIWIARRITDEHRAALDWLNDVTDERANFFGIEVELWRIGDSPVAPKLNVVSKPNEWTKAVSGATAGSGPKELTEYQRLQRDFWTGFREPVLGRESQLKPTTRSAEGSISMGIGRSGMILAVVLSKKDMVERTFERGKIRAQLLVGKNPEAWWGRLSAERDELEALLPDSLTWKNAEDKKSFKLYFRKPVDVENGEQWEDYFA